MAGYARGSRRAVELGDLDSMRDWGFAGDYVDGMWLMHQNEIADDFVLSTGRSTTIRDFVKFTANALDIDLEWTGESLSEQAVDRKTGYRLVRINRDFYRPAEVDYLIGDASKARKKLG